MWTAYLYQTINGRIGPKLNYESLSWSIELNGTESINISLPKSDLPKVDLNYWLAAWWAGVVILWNGVPIVAGPIITRPTESDDSVTVNCGGIRSILANRAVVGEFTNWDDLNDSNINFDNFSLGTIAQKVVQTSLKKIGGNLPINYAVPEQNSIYDNADHERNYKGFNLQNLICDAVLTKLSNVTGGPDIMFKPRLVQDNQLMFDMWNGTEKEPRIRQTQTQVWDTTPQKNQVVDMTVNYTGTYQASRVFSTGAGTDEGILIAVNTNDTLLQKGYPLLEKVINTSNSENLAVVSDHGKSTLQANEDALLEVQMTVRGDGTIPLGQFWPGDLAHIVTKGWLSIPDGLSEMRILSMSGDGTPNVRVSLQKDDRYDI